MIDRTDSRSSWMRISLSTLILLVVCAGLAIGLFLEKRKVSELQANDRELRRQYVSFLKRRAKEHLENNLETEYAMCINQARLLAAGHFEDSQIVPDHPRNVLTKEGIIYYYHEGAAPEDGTGSGDLQAGQIEFSRPPWDIDWDADYMFATIAMKVSVPEPITFIKLSMKNGGPHIRYSVVRTSEVVEGPISFDEPGRIPMPSK